MVRTLVLMGTIASACPAWAEEPAVVEERVGQRVDAIETTGAQTSDDFSDVVLVGTAAAYRCTGIVINERYVLTAAHCLPAERVGVGNGLEDARDVAVASSERHPSADVALLTLSKKLTMTTHSRREGSDKSAPIGAVRIVGFGLKDQLRLTGFGHKRLLDVQVDGWGCDRRRSRELICNVETEMLLRGGRGNDTCFGDSGGPVFEATNDTWRLVAIVSRGTRPKRILCGEGGIYTRVDVIDAWIKKRTL